MKIRPLVTLCSLALLVTLIASSGANAAPQLVAAGPAHLVSQPDHFATEFESAIDPNDSQRRAVAAIDANKPGTYVGCTVYLSSDGGQTWTPSNPFGAIPGSDLGLSGDPRVQIDNDGTIHVVCLLASGLQMGYVRSTDFGTTWSPVSLIPRISPEHGVDKPALYVTPAGRILVCALQNVDDPDPTSTRATIGMAVSDDQGSTWRVFEPPAFVGYSGTCMNFAADDDGNVFMGFLSLGGPKAALLTAGTFRTPDDGETWDTPATFGVQVRPGGPPPADIVQAVFDENGNNVFSFFPMIAVNRVSGSIVGAFGTSSEDQAHYQLFLSRSTDGGVTYQSIAAPTPPSAICEEQMYSPSLHFDSSGRLFMEFVCNDRLSKATASTREVWLTASLDDGDTWLAPTLLVREEHAPCTVPFVTAGVSQLNPCWRWWDGADYWFTTDAADGFHAYWVDYTGGTSSIRTQTFTIG